MVGASIDHLQNKTVIHPKNPFEIGPEMPLKTIDN